MLRPSDLSLTGTFHAFDTVDTLLYRLIWTALDYSNLTGSIQLIVSDYVIVIVQV
jgi:hypothetical protein